MEFPNLASTSVSLRGIFWLYASKDGSTSGPSWPYGLVYVATLYLSCSRGMRFTIMLLAYNTKKNNIFPQIQEGMQSQEIEGMQLLMDFS